MFNRNRDRKEKGRLHPKRTLFLILLIVATVESVIMMVIENRIGMSAGWLAFVDAWLLVIVSLPLLYRVVLLPLISEVHRHRVAELRLHQRTRRLREALREKDILLREVNHRVRNNLQFMAALLALPGNGEDNPQCASAVSACISRIHTVAVVHDHLLSGPDLTRIDLHSCAASIPNSILTRTGGVAALRVEGEHSLLHLDLAVPLALLLHELISGSGNFQDDLSITIAKNDEFLALQLKGMEPTLDERSRHLVAVLSRQVDATVAVESGGWLVRIPKTRDGKVDLWT